MHAQAERSQQNKNRALELLKTKLILKQKEEELLKINNIRGDQHELVGVDKLDHMYCNLINK